MPTTRRSKPTPARVVLDPPSEPEPIWCWRTDWRIGGESSYCLFGLLQALNVVTNKRLVAAFFEPVELPNGRQVKYHQVDLRSTRTLRVARLSRAVRQTPDEVIGSFTFEEFSVGGRRSYTVLRWCPTCIGAGFHANIFQMPITGACPAHDVQLLSKCPRCKSPIPYKIDPNDPLPLFTCFHCRMDLITKLRAGWRKPKLAEELVNRLVERERLLQFCDQLPMLTSEYLGTSAALGNSNFVVAAPKMGETVAAYSSFVTRVMSAVATKRHQLDLDDPSDACSFIEKEPAKCRTQMIEKAKPGWPAHLLPPSDAKLTAAACVYRSIRRHIWRKFVQRHRRCVISACRHLWWSLRGIETPSMCPVATAYLRWRMQWETVPIASMLMERPRAAPLGIVGWLASCAPVGSAAWTAKVDAWLTAEVLGRDLLAHFFTLLHQEMDRPRDACVTWNPSPINSLAGTCWVCVGRGTASHPVRLFVRSDEDESNLKRLVPTARHYREHRAQLARISH